MKQLKELNDHTGPKQIVANLRSTIPEGAKTLHFVFLLLHVITFLTVAVFFSKIEIENLSEFIQRFESL